MLDLKAIQENYEKMSLGMLKKTAKEPEKLHKEVVFILQKELAKRGEVKDAAFLADFIEGKDVKSILQKMSKEELQQLVKERLDSGEPKESVMHFLKENNISLSDVLGVATAENEAEKKALNGMKILAVLYFLANFKEFVMFGSGYLREDIIPMILIAFANFFSGMGLANLFMGLGLWFKRKKIFYIGVGFFGLFYILVLALGYWSPMMLLSLIGLGIAMSYVKYMK